MGQGRSRARVLTSCERALSQGKKAVRGLESSRRVQVGERPIAVGAEEGLGGGGGGVAFFGIESAHRVGIKNDETPAGQLWRRRGVEERALLRRWRRHGRRRRRWRRRWRWRRRRRRRWRGAFTNQPPDPFRPLETGGRVVAQLIISNQVVNIRRTAPAAPRRDSYAGLMRGRSRMEKRP